MNPIDMTNFMICPKINEQIPKTICVRRSTSKDPSCVDCERGKEILKESHITQKEKKEEPLTEIKTEPLTNKLNIPLIHLDPKPIIEEAHKTGFKQCDICKGTGKIEGWGNCGDTCKCISCKDGWVPITPKQIKLIKDVKKDPDWKCENCKRGEDKATRRGKKFCTSCGQIHYKNTKNPELQKQLLKEFAERVSNGKVKRSKIEKSGEKVKRIKEEKPIEKKTEEKIDLSGSSLLNTKNEESSKEKQIVLTFKTERELDLYYRLTKFAEWSFIHPHYDKQIMIILHRYLKKDVNYKGEFIE